MAIDGEQVLKIIDFVCPRCKSEFGDHKNLYGFPNHGPICPICRGRLQSADIEMGKRIEAPPGLSGCDNESEERDTFKNWRADWL